MYPTRPALEVVSAPFKRSQLGLFHGKMKQYGNNVPFSKKKTRRTWLPNVQNKSLHSDLLNQSFKIKITTRALRTMHKVGTTKSTLFMALCLTGHVSRDSMADWTITF